MKLPRSVNPERVGLIDVAREAGVSTTLVSRVLRGKQGNVRFSKETEQRVRSVADRLGYVPRRDAQNLKHRRSRTVALLSPQSPAETRGTDAWGNHFLHQLLLGIEAACAPLEYNCLYSHWSVDDSPHSHPRIMLDRSVDGVVLTDFTLSPVVDHLLQTGVRCVQIGSNIDPDCRIDRYFGDLEQAIRDVVGVFYDQGHRRVRMLQPIGFGPAAIASAFLEAVSDRPDLAGDTVDCDRNTPETIRRLAAAMAAETDRPTAVICPNGKSSVAFAEAMAEHGLQCPRDYCMLTWVSEGWPTTYLPGSGLALATIDLPYFEVARVAASDLIDSLESSSNSPAGDFQNHTWPCKVNWRDSANPEACQALSH